MKASSIASSITSAALLFASSVNAQVDASSIDPLIISGKHFFYKTNGSEFFIRGVAYQQDYIANASDATNAQYTDPLADSASCERDIPYLVQLRTNVIRTYAIDPTVDHSACMNALAAAGIYVISDLSAPEQSINRNDPAWTTDLYARYTTVIDNMAKYQNTIGFFAGNEVSNSYNTTSASAYVKAAVRDSKAYIVSQGYRPLYVGYATYDGPIRNQLADYFNCGDAADAIDFWGYNVYSWCGDSNYVESGYENRTEFFSNYSVPAFFAEYGCNTNGVRQFTEVQALFGPNMTGVWSGGIVYMYFQETNNYGLVTLVNSASVSPLADFTSLSMQMAIITPSSTASSNYPTGTLSAQACPTMDAMWSATPTPLPPTPNQALCDCMVQSLDCVVNNATNILDYGNNFNYICSHDNSACDAILTNGSTGVFGAYSGCTNEQQLSFVMNRWYADHGSVSSACYFNGNATITAGSVPSGTCASLLNVAGTSGGGSVPPPTGTPSYTETSVAGSGVSVAATGATSSSSSSQGAASGFVVQSYSFGYFHLGLYVFGAFLTGAGMILL